MDVERRARQQAYWFYVVAGASVLNALGHVWILGASSLVSVILAGAVGDASGSAGLKWFLVFTFVSPFVALGYFSSIGRRWAYLTGMILYGIDALLFMSIFRLVALFGLLFHGLILWRIWIGYSSLVALQTSESAFRNAAIQAALKRKLEEGRAEEPPAPYIAPKPFLPPRP